MCVSVCVCVCTVPRRVGTPSKGRQQSSFALSCSLPGCVWHTRSKQNGRVLFGGRWKIDPPVGWENKHNEHVSGRASERARGAPNACLRARFRLIVVINFPPRCCATFAASVCTRARTAQRRRIGLRFFSTLVCPLCRETHAYTRFTFFSHDGEHPTEGQAA